MLITRAPLSTAHRIAFASASTAIVPLGETTFATTSSAAGERPAMPVELSSSAAMTPATIVPWPRVSWRRCRSRSSSRGRCADEVRMHAIDPGVDHRDANGRERRQRLPGVVGAVRDRVPLARRERVGRLERETALARRLDPGDARNCSKRRETCIGGQRPKRREPLDARARRRSIARATTAGSAPGSIPTWARAPRLAAGNASAAQQASAPRRARRLTS